MNNYYQTNNQGHLIIGGVDALELAKNYGTPLVVYDVAQIRQQFQAFQQAFTNLKVNSVISYASKAFSAIAMYQLINQLKGHIDVVSGGNCIPRLKQIFRQIESAFMAIIKLKKN